MTEEESKIQKGGFLKEHPEMQYGCVSLGGMQELIKLQKEGLPLPEGYVYMVKNYLAIKVKEVSKWEEAVKKAKSQFLEALHLAKELGVEW